MREIKIDIGALMPIIEEKLARGGEVIFSPNGISMIPTLKPGVDTAVLVAAPDKMKKYDIALFRAKNGQYVLHRVIRTGESYTFIGDSRFECERDIPREDIIALCIARVRDGKRVRLDSCTSRSFARFWHATRPIRRFGAGVKRRLRTIFGK